MARAGDAALRDRVLEACRLRTVDGDGDGPLATAVRVGRFDHVHVLSNYPADLNAEYHRWLGAGAGCTVHPVTLTGPTDYGSIFAAVDGVMGEVVPVAAGAEWNILLSPGTPAMTAVWVLLGKSRYPARFFQTYRGELTEAVIPYDLLTDYLPAVLREPDAHLQRAAEAAGTDPGGFEGIVGRSPAVRAAKRLAARAAVRDVTVLLLGASGTGKEAFARAIHETSHRKDGPFVAVNCGAIPTELQEAELFGHTKGAFTGADRERAGAFARADGGTLFLDELGECPAALQVKLLRVLQPPDGQGPCCRRFELVGGKAHTADVRIVAATKRDLPREIAAGRFREDLYYRLSVIEIPLPPLAERAEDVPLLVDHLLARVNADFARHEPGYRHKRLSPAAKSFLVRQPWPGNVRQLHNLLVRAAVLTDGEEIDRTDLESVTGTAARPASLLDCPLGDGFDIDEHVKAVHRHFLRRAMTEAGGNKAQAARLLGMKHYQTLSAQLERLGVEWDEPSG